MASNSTAEPSLKERVILVGVGGPTCSGKTTLAKHLRNIIPNSFIVHQDDFAPPEDLVPYHPVHDVQDWDDPPGAIDWPRLTSFLATVKETGRIPDSHKSHDHLNPQTDLPLDAKVREKWRETFGELENELVAKGERVTWGLIDGFLLYWHPDVVDALDVRIFIRTPEELLRKRREDRAGYHTAEGTLWRDPPNYWENIVYPAYLKAHASIFVDGDVEHGALSEHAKEKELVVIRGDGTVQYGEVVDEACEAIVRFARR